MKKIALLTSLALSTLAADPAAAPAKDAQQLLRDGLFEEEANLDLGKAAAAYAEVIANYDVQRQISGTAVFRLAEIRAKQGKKDEAAALYQRVIAEFATFEQIAKSARERLAKLGAALPDAASKESGITQAESDELVKLREMAANSPDLLNASDGKDTPLSRAAANGWVKAAEYLLANGAQIGRPGYSIPLFAAATAGHKRMVELFLDKGATIEAKLENYSPLIAACQQGRASIVRLLIERGAAVNPPSEGGRTPLHVAVGSGDVSIVRLLLEKGAKPNVVMKSNSDSFTPLGLAKTKEMAALLLEHKATPDLGLADGVVQPLTYAARSGDLEFVELLLQRLGKVSDPQPLFFAIEQKNLAILEKLLAHHSNVDGKDASERTPLLAACQQSPEFVPALLKAGASPRVQLPSGETPLFFLITSILSAQNPRPSQSNSAPSGAAGSIGASRPRRVALPSPSGFPQPQPTIQPPIPSPAPQIPTPATTLKREELQDIIKALIAHGADINAPIAGTPPLWFTSDIELFDWLVSLGADPYAKAENGTPRVSLIGNPESRIALESRYLYPKIAPKDGVLSVTLSREPVAIRTTTEFEPLPTFAEVLARTFPANGTFGFDSGYQVAVYRMGTKGRYEEAAKIIVKPLSTKAENEAARWPQLSAGDVVIVQLIHNGSPRNASDVQEWLVPALPKPRITVDVGGRTQHVIFAKTKSNTWVPQAEACPARNLADLARLVVFNGEPGVDLSAVKIIRTVDGKPREWAVDLSPNPAKDASIRLADGDRVVFPTQVTPESIAKRRGGQWIATPGRVFAGMPFIKKTADIAPFPLSEMLLSAQDGSPGVMDVDLSKITIHRLKNDAGEEEHIAVDLTPAYASWKLGKTADAAKADVQLQWGDVVELGVKPAAKPTDMRSLADDGNGEFLRDMLARTVLVTVDNGPTEKIRLAPVDIQKCEAREENGLLEWKTRSRYAHSFRISEAVKKTIGDKPCRVRVTTGGKTRMLAPKEVDAATESLRDGDIVEITRL